MRSEASKALSRNSLCLVGKYAGLIGYAQAKQDCADLQKTPSSFGPPTAPKFGCSTRRERSDRAAAIANLMQRSHFLCLSKERPLKVELD
jgi:hypothetical protein